MPADHRTGLAWVSRGIFGRCIDERIIRGIVRGYFGKVVKHKLLNMRIGGGLRVMRVTNLQDRNTLMQVVK